MQEADTAINGVVSMQALKYGDGSDKIFGMENFGNTCYCNSILQCLYYTEKFRKLLASHEVTDHERKLVTNGVYPHAFTKKYEQLLLKKLKEDPKAARPALQSSENERNKVSRKGSLFGIKFSSAGSSSTANNSGSSNASDGIDKKKPLILAKDCEFLSSEQRMFIKRNPKFQNLELMVTRSSHSNYGNLRTHSQVSSMLHNNESGVISSNNKEAQNNGQRDEMTVSNKSCIVVVGISLIDPLAGYQFNSNPSVDQRKRSALINGPIINLDHSLQLPSRQSDDSALLYALKDMYESMIEHKSQVGVVSPSYFVSQVKEKNFLFRQDNMHQDAHEFFNYLINEIIECLDKEVGAEGNWCNKLFQGLITNETKCLTCETITSKEECFLDLPVDIPTGESAYSLTYSLNNFSSQETLRQLNKFYCNTCCSLQEATKTIKLGKLPEVIVINFKRFKYDEKVGRMIKLFDSVSYPLKLRLFNTKSNPDDENRQTDDLSLYELYALVVHIGGGPMHGHYISLCKNSAGLWLLFDDETVEVVDENYVMRFFGDGPGLASAYILFYQKCETTDKEVDFGFEYSDIYDGNDYEISQMGTDSLSSEALNSKREGKNSPSETSSIIEQAETELEKNLDCFSISPKYSKDSRLTTPTFSESPVNLRLNVKRDAQASNNPPRENTDLDKEKETTKPEKKTWVGGLMRRESKLSNALQGSERKTSDGSNKSISGSGKTSKSGNTQEKEKRKSLFGFKKNKS